MIGFLFERLGEESAACPRERIVAALDRLLVVQSECDREAPPGVMNFGLPRPPDVQPGQRAGEAYAELVNARILEFEPRIHSLKVEYADGKVRITAELEDGEPLDLARSIT
jgi:predicted component of type VI protein secretion system